MEVVFEQAVNGDLEGAYALLDTTMPGKNVASRYHTRTDLKARPTDGIQWSPVIRGFEVDKHYFFIKTFKDESAGVRSGRVFSHVFITETRNLSHINDLSIVLNALPKAINKKARLTTLSLQTVITPPARPVSSRIKAALQEFLDIDCYNNTIVWVGKEGFEELVTVIWNNSSAHIREQLSFDVAFQPKDVDTSKISIIWIPPSVLTHWSASGFAIIDSDQQHTDSGMAVNYLAGDKINGAGIIEAADLFKITPKDPWVYKELERLAIVTSASGYMAPVTDLLLSADILSKLNPSPSDGQHQRRQILTNIAAKLQHATAIEIAGIANVNWQGFEEVEQQLGPSIERWIEKYFNSDTEIDFSTIIKVLRSHRTSWWHKTIANAVKRVFLKWDQHYASFVWDWWRKNQDTVDETGEWLPSSSHVEQHMVQSMPKIVNDDMFDKVLQFSANKTWLLLHGALLMRRLSLSKALSRQLSIDNQPGHLDALRTMTAQVPDPALIGAALEVNHQKIYSLVAERILCTPLLLNDIDPKNDEWLQLWLVYIKSGGEAWDGIVQPEQVLFALLDRVVAEEIIDDELLLFLSGSRHAGLQKYPRRQQLWSYVSGKTKKNLVLATIKQMLMEGGSGAFLIISGAETEIRSVILQPEMAHQLIKDENLPFGTRLELFERVKELYRDSSLFEFILEAGHISPLEAVMVGKMVSRLQWRSGLQLLMEKAERDDIFIGAVRECWSMVSIFKKLTHSRWAPRTGSSITEDEWWSTFSEKCTTIYQRGPEENGLWTRAGGEVSDLPISGTGKEKWIFVLAKLRKGAFSKITVSRLLREMVSENQNEELKILNEIYKDL